MFLFIQGKALFLQCILRAVLLSFEAKNAFRTVFSFTGIVRNFDVHRADTFTFAAADAFVVVAFDSGDRKITHRFQENRDRTDIFTERSVILKDKCQRDSDRIICDISDQERPEHNPLEVSDMGQKQSADKYEG